MTCCLYGNSTLNDFTVSLCCRLASSAHLDFVHGLSWHPSETSLLTCGWDGQVMEHRLNEAGTSLMLSLMYA